MGLLLRLLGICLVVASAHALALTRDENAAYLGAAQADPDEAFHNWALRHKRPYATALLPLLPAYLPQLTSRLEPSMQHTLTTLTPAQLITTLLAKLPMQAPNGGGLLLQEPAKGAPKLNQVDFVQLHRHLATYGSRKQAWLSNLQYAVSSNKEGRGYWLGLNGLADLSFDEYSRLLGTKTAHKAAASVQEDPDPSHPHRMSGFMYDNVDVSSLPRAVDWRNNSAVTPVKNQGMCGSCWAFATTGAIEGANAIFTKKLLSLSEQELVDCDRDVDMGCNGGMMDNAYEFIIQSKGLHTEEDWPYTAEEALEGCTLLEHTGGNIVTIDGYQDVPVGDEAALLKAAAHQPIAVAVEADSRAFQLYMGGVMADPGCGSQLNHGVLVVGYGGLDSGRFPTPGHKPEDPSLGPYWIVKNSWGEAWGVGGYIKLQMGFKDNETGLEGLCGITLAASYPVKTSPNPKPAPKPDPKPQPPKPDPSKPVQCDAMYSCPPESTCCCVDDQWAQKGGRKMRDNAQCGQWGCCPMAGAICCEDKLHCCPPQLPVCDVAQGRCQQGKAGGLYISWLRNMPAVKSPQQQEAEERPMLLRPSRRSSIKAVKVANQ